MKIDEIQLPPSARCSVGPGILHQLEFLIEQNETYARKLNTAKTGLRALRRSFPETKPDIAAILQDLEAL